MKNIISFFLSKFTNIFFLFRLKLQFFFNIRKPYQINYLKNNSLKSNEERSCYDRLEKIKSIKLNFGSILDIGCNEGFFTYNLVDNDYFGLGIDEDRNAIYIAESIVKLKEKKNISYLNLELTFDKIKKLPNCDTVVFLSVFHHWVNRYGKETSINMFSELCKKANKYIIFESGQPSEKGFKWSKKISFMDDYENWIHNFFNDIWVSGIRSR